jgi:GNAT superfamily N-acetyltransferase
MVSNQYIIRDAKLDDVEQLAVLLAQLGYPTTAAEVRIRISNINQNPDYRTLVVTEGDRVIGLTGLVKGFWYEKNGLYVRILVFVISEDQRGRGIGKLLIKAVEDWGLEIGANSVILSSGNRDERVGAHKFYQSLGYEIKSSGFIKQL